MGIANNSFDQLVSGLSHDERLAMLKNIQDTARAVEVQTFALPESESNAVVPLSEEYVHEGLFYRIWIWIRSFITGVPKNEVYNEDKVARLASEVSRTYAGLIDYSHEFLLQSFYEDLVELRSCAAFFKPYLDRVTEDPGAFYAYLGIFLMADMTESLNDETDPFNFPITTTINRERRVTLLHRMEEILKTISADDRAAMYEGVSGAEWLRQFCSLPFDRFINLFTKLDDTHKVCMFANIGTEMEQFAKVLCAGKTVTGELLETLFLYTHRDAENDGEPIHTFLTTAQSYLSAMHVFVSTVPMRSLSAIVYKDAAWQPDVFGGAEDWFLKFKESWKKLFDRRWNLWVQACRKEAQRQTLHNQFGLEQFPSLPYHPWEGDWKDIKFHYELTAGFLHWFMENRYDVVIQAIKTLLLKGIFSYPENKEELVSATNTLSRLELESRQFVHSLSPSGEVGLILEKLSGEKIRTLQGQNKIESVVSAAEQSVKKFQGDFCDACRSVLAILAGAFEESASKDYGPVKNLRLIKTADNHDFVEELYDIKALLSDTLEMINQIEVIDATGAKAQE